MNEEGQDINDNHTNNNNNNNDDDDSKVRDNPNNPDNSDNSDNSDNDSDDDDNDEFLSMSMSPLGSNVPFHMNNNPNNPSELNQNRNQNLRKRKKTNGTTTTSASTHQSLLSSHGRMTNTSSLYTSPLPHHLHSQPHGDQKHTQHIQHTQHSQHSHHRQPFPSSIASSSSLSYSSDRAAVPPIAHGSSHDAAFSRLSSETSSTSNNSHTSHIRTQPAILRPPASLVRSLGSGSGSGGDEMEIERVFQEEFGPELALELKNALDELERDLFKNAGTFSDSDHEFSQSDHDHDESSSSLSHPPLAKNIPDRSMSSGSHVNNVSNNNNTQPTFSYVPSSKPFSPGSLKTDSNPRVAEGSESADSSASPVFSTKTARDLAREMNESELELTCNMNE